MGASFSRRAAPRENAPPRGAESDTKCANVGATAAATGRPEQGSAPSGGSAAHEVASVGATAAAKGRPEQGSAPSGGSEPRAAGSVGATFKPGMYARGEFELGSSGALTVAQTAVVVRDGFSYVAKVGPDNKVSQVKVQTGRMLGDQLEVVSGLKAEDRVVASGAGFLSDGDLVKVVAAPTVSTAPPGVKQAVALVPPAPNATK